MPSTGFEGVQKSSLKLKGVDVKISKKKKKKSKKSSKEKDRKEHEGNRNEEEPKAGTSSGSAASDAPYRNKTKTEIAFLKRKEELDKAKLKDRASTTHKEKVEKFNTYLESLSEHYEQAKVSWTK